MGCGFVGTVTVDLQLPQAGSLKDKRKELLRIKAMLVKRLSCAVAEVDHHDLHRRTRLSLAVVTREASDCDRLVALARRVLHEDPAAIVVEEAYDVQAVDGTPGFLRSAR